MPDSWVNSEAYESYVGRWSRQVARRFLDWIGMGPGRRWLDLGCGTGALTEKVLARCAPTNVISVDPSEEFLAAARSRIRDARATFRQGSGERIPVDDAAVDCAVSGLALNFIPDKEAAMNELGRCVGPGGTVAAYVWDYAGHVQFMRRFWDAAVALDPEARALDEGVRFPVCRPGPLRTLFEAAGLGEVETVAIDIPTAYRDFDDYWTPFLSGVGPAPGYCASLAPAAREALRTRLRETLPTDADGMILLAARAWAVKGRR